MERLSNIGKLTGVEKLSDRWMYYSGLLACMGVPVDDMKHIQNLIDAEEQGLLLRLPCKVGDVVYHLTPKKNDFIETNVTRIVVYNNDIQIALGSGRVACIESVGKTIFLTKEEAEQALARMEAENG